MNRKNKRKISDDGEDSQPEREDPILRKQQVMKFNDTLEQMQTAIKRYEYIPEGPVDRSIISTDSYVKMRLRSYLFDEITKNEENLAENKEDKKKPMDTGKKQKTKTPKSKIKATLAPKDIPLTIEDFTVDPSYRPVDPTRPSTSALPETVERLRIKEDLSEANQECHTVPVYCDRGKKSTDFCLTDRFTYAKTNCVDDPLFDPKGTVQICCTCEDECSPASCECMKLQKKAFGDVVQYLGGGFVRDSLNYFNKKTKINMDTVALIMCGNNCRCSKNVDENDHSPCRNHIDQLRTTGRFELFRRDVDLGFGLRALNHFEIDEVVSEFVGKLRSSEEVATDDRFQNYSLEVCGKDMYYIMDRLVRAHSNLSDEDLHLYDTKDLVKRRMAKGQNKTPKIPDPCWYVDPHGYGNISRFFSHGCFGNVVPFRVISNYLHPHYHHIFFKAIIPIPAGTELSFNYGADYIGRAAFNCKCDTIMCHSDPKKKKFWASKPKTEFVNALMDIVRHYRKVIAEKNDYYNNDANKELLKGYVPAEPVHDEPPEKKRLRAESPLLQQRNIENSEIYGTGERRVEYNEAAYRHFMNVGNTYLFGKAVDESEERKRIEEIAGKQKTAQRTVPAKEENDPDEEEVHGEEQAPGEEEEEEQNEGEVDAQINALANDVEDGAVIDDSD